MNRTLFTSAVCTLAGALIASADVPSLITYQGRLTDSNGAPVTGSKTFAISIYDAATAGNLLYSESIGAVTLDSNGVYSFQFGNAGTSNTQVTETIGTTAGSTLSYTKTLSNTPVVANSITVTDGTNSWSQSVGNPGVGATATANTISGFVIGVTITNGGSGYTSAPAVTITGAGSGAEATASITNGVVTGITIINAGSGYTGGATITVAPPVIPFRVDYSGGAITATYSFAPSSGSAITANYRYGTSGIGGALSYGNEHWMAINVNGENQAGRQRIIAVPFARKSEFAENAVGPLKSRIDDSDNQLRNINRLYNSRFGVNYSGLSSSVNFKNNIIGMIGVDPANWWGIRTIDFPQGEFVLSASSEGAGYDGDGWIQFTYLDGTTVQRRRQIATGTHVFKNPNPGKLVSKVESYELAKNWNGPNGNSSTLKVFSIAPAIATYDVNLSAKEVMVTPVLSNYSVIERTSIKLIFSDGSFSVVNANDWVALDSSKVLSKVTVIANATVDGESTLSGVKILTP
jgi:hypothetical protein